MHQRLTKYIAMGLAGASLAVAGALPAAAHGDAEGGLAEGSLFFVDYRNLNGGADGVLLLDLDPESPNFGSALQNFEMGEGVTPHHLYFNRDASRLYNTTLGGEYLYELTLEHDAEGVPQITGATSIDVGESRVGEDMYFTEDGNTFWMTFMGGFGGQLDGTVGVFDAETNALLETIVAPMPDPASDEPFILYPHGISANEALGQLMVTSASHPDLISGAGNTVTVIDMETREPRQTLLVAESPDELTVPVEALLLRGEFPPYALVTTVLGGDVWIAPYDEAGENFGEFTKAFDGSDNNIGVALEFYIGPGGDPDSDEDKWLYVSYSVPGSVQVFSLDNLPELELVKTLPAGAGAHHMAFFTTESGREVMVVQNNFLNQSEPVPQNEGTLTVVDVHSGEVVGELNLPETLGLMPESIESALGNGHFVHH